MRIARTALAGSGRDVLGGGALAHLEDLAFRRDVFLKDIKHSQELKQIDLEVKALEAQMQDPGEAAFFGFLESALPAGLNVFGAGGGFEKLFEE